MDAGWTQVTPSDFPWEREALAFLEEGLPDHEPYRAWANFEFVLDGQFAELGVSRETLRSWRPPAPTRGRREGNRLMTDLANTLGTNEQDTLEFKRDLSNRDAIRRAICALANDLPGQGVGTLLIGVADDGTPHGLVVDDAALLRVVSVRDEGRVLPRPVLRVTEGLYQGQRVIRVDVTASDFPPVRFDGSPR